MTAPPADLAQALADRYHLERELGAGGMATVYLAHDHRHGRSVAVKVFRPELAKSLGADRFLREIQLAAQLHHPHILPLHDSGEAAGYLYYLMPFVDGETLRARMRREGRLPIDAALHITREVADALGYAHRRGVIHRDIKPENILLADGHAFVADFGIARALDSASQQLTQTGFALGTPAYMAPEQAVGDKQVDGRADLYALACVLYEMLTGEPPFTGATQQAILVKRFTEPVPALRAMRPDVPDWLDRLVTRTLDKDPAERPADALAFAAAFGGVVVTPSGPPREPERSVVVLPFANQSPDPNDAFLGDGVTDELITDLSRVKGLRVISRASAMRLKGTDRSPSEIAKLLNVRYLLDGTVRRVGDTLQLTAQLVDSATDATIWADKFRGAGTALFELQATLGLAVTDALAIRAADRPTQDDRRITDPGAYECYLRARQELMRLTPEGAHAARRLLEAGLVRSPKNPVLLGTLGLVHAKILDLGFDEAAWQEVARFIDVLRAAAPASPMIHTLTAVLESVSERCDRLKVVRGLLAGVRADPNDPDLVLWTSPLAMMAPPSIVRPFFEHLPEIDPLSPVSHLLPPWLDAMEGHPDVRLDQARKVFAAQVDKAGIGWVHGVILRQCGHDEEATAAFAATESGGPSDVYGWSSGIIRRALTGDVAGVRAEVASAMASRARRDFYIAWMVASACATAGLLDEAMEWLTVAVDRGVVNFPFLAKYDRTLAPLRTRPDFHALMQRARPEYEAAIAEFVDPAEQPKHYAEVARAAAGMPKAIGSPNPVPTAPPPVATESNPSIAVLPFANMSSDPENEYFSDGISEELINSLTQIPNLKVIARTSAFAFKGKAVDVREIGRALGVTTVLEGSVRKAGGQLRITAQLIDTADGSHKWSARYDRALADVFAIQDEITAAISSAVGGTLLGRRAETRYQTDPTTFDLYLRGKALLSRGAAAFAQGKDLVEQANRRDPRFVPALVSLGDAYCLVTWWALIPAKDGWARIRTIAEEIRTRDPSSAAADHLLAAVASGADRNFPAAVGHARRAIARNPSDVLGHAGLTLPLWAIGDRVESEAHARQLLVLDPLSPVVNVVVSNHWSVVGRFDEAEATASAAIDLDPGYPEGYHMRGLARVYQGRFQEAHEDLLRVPELGNQSPWPIAKRCAALAGLGRFSEVRQALGDILARRATEFMTPDAIACIYGLLGERDEAFRWLEVALKEQAFWLGFLGIEPLFAPLRSDPRFEPFCRRANIPIQPLVPTALDRLVPPAASPTAAAQRPDASLVVLPFTNVSPDPDTDYFADGLTEEVIADLSNIRALKVIARNSAMRLKGTDQDAHSLGNQLGVRYVLAGSVRRAGAQLRITAQLADTAEDRQIWAGKYAGTLEEVFDLQERLSREIVAQLRVTLGVDEQRALAERPIKHPKAYELYLRARQETGKTTEPSFVRAIELLEEAGTIEGPNIRLATATAMVYWWYLGMGWDTPFDPMARAERQVATIRSLDAASPEAEFIDGALDSFRHDFVASARKVRRALAARPANPDALFAFGFSLTEIGQPDRAVPRGDPPSGPRSALVFHPHAGRSSGIDGGPVSGGRGPLARRLGLRARQLRPAVLPWLGPGLPWQARRSGGAHPPVRGRGPRVVGRGGRHRLGVRQ